MTKEETDGHTEFAILRRERTTMRIVAIQRGSTKDRDKYLVDLQEKSQGQIIDVHEGILWPPMGIDALLMRGYWEPIEHTDQLLDEILAAVSAKQVMKQASIVGGPERSRKSVKESEGVHGITTPINLLTHEERLRGCRWTKTLNKRYVH